MKRRFTEDSWRKEPWFKGLCAAFGSLKSEEEIADFLRDVGTLSELQAWSERLEVARLLGRGLSYRQVAAQTGASTTTVTRVANFLENGAGGYRNVLKVHRHHRMMGHAESPQPKPQPQPEQNMPAEPQPKPQTPPVPTPVSPLQKYLQKDQ